MRLFERKVSEVEYKLRLLMCVDALQMVTRDQLWPFVARLALMDYVPMCLAVDELLSSGAFQLGEGAIQDALYLTEAGREQLRLFGSRMPASDRARITEAAPDYLRALGRRRQQSAVYELPRDGMKRVRCTFQEGDVPTLILRIETPDDSVSHAAVERFSEVAPALLGKLYRLKGAEGVISPKTYDDMESALEAVAPGKPVLCAYGKREHAAVVCLECDRTRCTVALLMPSAGSAARWARAASRDGGAIAQGLISDLCRDDEL